MAPRIVEEAYALTDTREIIRDVLMESGLPAREIEMALETVKGESQFDCSGFNWDVFHNKATKTWHQAEARGCWQITRLFHPEVSDDCAFDARCSTKTILSWWKEGPKRRCQEWTEYRKRYSC